MGRFALLLGLALLFPVQTTTPKPVEGDFVIEDFRFTSGETLHELRIHYRTLGTPRKDAEGRTTNAVLIMHGTGGTGGQFTGNFAGELFGPGQPLDATEYVIHEAAPTLAGADRQLDQYVANYMKNLVELLETSEGKK